MPYKDLCDRYKTFKGVKYQDWTCIEDAENPKYESIHPFTYSIMNKLINLYIFGISLGYTDYAKYTGEFIRREYYFKILSRSRFNRLKLFKSW